MLIKTADLIDLALNWAVAQALVMTEGYRDRGLLVHRIGYGQAMPLFSTDWNQGGPIIEQERISTKPYTLGTDWFATVPSNTGGHLQNGPTPLIAAMRCFVASKLGDEVEIPKELK